MKSADRELVEVKTELRQETEKAKNKSAELYQRIGELEQQMSAETAERKRALEELQVLQDELDTHRKEVVFKEHCLVERKEKLCEEKQAMRARETEQASGKNSSQE